MQARGDGHWMAVGMRERKGIISLTHKTRKDQVAVDN